MRLVYEDDFHRGMHMEWNISHTRRLIVGVSVGVVRRGSRLPDHSSSIHWYGFVQLSRFSAPILRVRTLERGLQSDRGFVKSRLEQENSPGIISKESRQLGRRFLSKEVERTAFFLSAKKSNGRRSAQCA